MLSCEQGTDEMTHMFADPLAYARATYGEPVTARWGGIELPSRRPKLLITPIFHDFFRFFPVFPGTFGRAHFHRLAETVPTSRKPEPRARKQWQGRPNTVSPV